MRKAIFPGEELRRQREALGWSVDDVYRKARIPVSCIEALEDGNVRGLPAPCYTVGFLKSYCHLLGLEPDRYLDSLRSCLRPTHRFLRRPVRGETTWPAWLGDALTWAAVCAVIALGWLTYMAAVRPRNTLKDGRVEAGTVELVIPPAPPVLNLPR
ncbi:MAG: helix-turn-helix domain-containing protein [Candidatus Hydrogenedentes bacterium]|nr:helix-turn-helix domain-containing protein [Candidatus Hydrogenedentota bacterium]